MKKSTEADKSRIVFHTWGYKSLRNEAASFLDKCDCSLPPQDINDALEMFNVYRVLESDSLCESEKERIKSLYSTVARFFQRIDDNTFAAYHQSVLIDYYDDFLVLFERFKSYENVSPIGFSRIFKQEGFTLYKILEHKGIVAYYDETLSDYMKTSDQTAEIIIRKYLEEQPGKSIICYLPKSLDKKLFDGILRKYIESDFPHINLVNLISYSQSSAECPLSDELRQRAKHRATELYNKVAVKSEYSYEIGVSFEDIKKLKQESQPEPGRFLITYNAKWLRENTDIKSILFNFIHVFSFTDIFMRCSFPVVQSQFGALERHLGITGIREYRIGNTSHIINQYALATMSLYYNFLRRQGVYLENFIQDFFCNYLPEEFSVSGFDINLSTHNYSDLDKCRVLLSEMDGILKQFVMFVRNKHIDMELYEMSSSPIVFKDIPSLITDKYAYANGNDFNREMAMCFSDQCMLSYNEKYSKNKHYDSFVNLVRDNQVKIEDYPDFDHADLNWLINRGTIRVSESGIIALNNERISILSDYYNHDVIRTSKFDGSSEYQRLIANNDLVVETSMFSRPEQQYINYMLNKKEYSNGRDLRNKYIHGSYPRDKNKHFNDYMELLRIMVLVIIKINEEFCSWCDKEQ